MKQAWDLGFDSVSDHDAYIDAVLQDPEYNDLMRLFEEAANRVRAIWRETSQYPRRWAEAWGLGFVDPFDYERYRDSLGRPYGEGFEHLWEPETCSICDGIHGSLCPIESPDPLYYGDEQRQGR